MLGEKEHYDRVHIAVQSETVLGTDNNSKCSSCSRPVVILCVGHCAKLSKAMIVSFKLFPTVVFSGTPPARTKERTKSHY